MSDEIRDADGCEDYESLEESGLHDEAEDTAETEETAEPEDVIGDETDDGEPEIVEADPLEQAMQAANDKYMRLFAEFDNFRKRTAKEKAETYQDAVAKIQELPDIFRVLRHRQHQRKSAGSLYPAHISGQHPVTFFFIIDQRRNADHRLAHRNSP